MRKINKNYANPPADLVGNGCNRQLVRIVSARNGSGSSYYGRRDVVRALNDLYHSKCAYCESQINVVATENVEHYRPKAGVHVSDLIPGAVHLGYYWLGNEWSNLLISCPKCNQNGNKGTRFPLRNPNRRVSTHPAYLPAGTVDITLNHFGLSPIVNEDPLIINPELKNPDLHFSVLSTGYIEIKRNSLYASTTRDVCDLDRHALVVARKKIIDDMIARILELIEERYSVDGPIDDVQYGRLLTKEFKRLLIRIDETSEYTMVGRNLLKNFETMIVGDERIDPLYRPELLTNFLEWLET